jgi:sulfite reductase alpha subunit-like flavoprotein
MCHIDRKVPAHWDSVLTLRKMFENYLDIFSTPRRSFFEFLSFFTTNEDHTEKLKEFCSAEGQVRDLISTFFITTQYNVFENHLG